MYRIRTYLTVTKVLQCTYCIVRRVYCFSSSLLLYQISPQDGINTKYWCLNLVGMLDLVLFQSWILMRIGKLKVITCTEPTWISVKLLGASQIASNQWTALWMKCNRWNNIDTKGFDLHSELLSERHVLIILFVWRIISICLKTASIMY
jgi:hypothetical protein